MSKLEDFKYNVNGIYLCPKCGQMHAQPEEPPPCPPAPKYELRGGGVSASSCTYTKPWNEALNGPPRNELDYEE